MQNYLEKNAEKKIRARIKAGPLKGADQVKVAFVEIQNFRKLQSCRIEFGAESTVFVGANNSGKTSAMTALKKFLRKRQLVLNDFTITNFIGINGIGRRILEPQEENPILPEEWLPLLPTMDVWLDVKSDELRYVAEIIPTLDWTEGKIGIRLLYEPKDYEKLYGDFADAYQKAHDGKEGLKLWPVDFCDFLGAKMQSLFTMNSYILDPEKIQDVSTDDSAQPQAMPIGVAPLNFDPFKNLIRVDIISAQRGLDDSDDKDDNDVQPTDSSLLSDQLRSYYDKQLDPEHEPSASDLKALKELQGASEVFNEQISKKFHKAMKELAQFGYPGKYNPNIIVEAKTKAGDVLSHNTTVRYPLFTDEEIPYTLPERYNGLGYQNLISMSFKLMSFRDSWMNGNRNALQEDEKETKVIPPIHLVLIEEPEAHLHTQVQQVFIKNAYKILRNHPKLKSKKIYSTQLLVTTHSSYIALESKFENLRYFRRTRNTSKLPTTVVANLNSVFGSQNDATAKFVTRYLKTTHCDLFFADAVIIVEGAAERMLLPHFIDHHYEQLNQTYISILEINGRHAHRLRSLIEALGIFCLIITDIDTVDPVSKKSVMPQRNKSQISTNETIINWIPMQSSADKLWAATPEEKQIKYENNPEAYIRVAYQTPIKVKFSDDSEHELIPTTFEDALAYENFKMFKTLKGLGTIKKLRTIFKNEDADKISKSVYELIYGATDGNTRKKGIDKAEFALQLLYNKDPQKITPPSYIAEALHWLEDSLIRREDRDFVSEEEA